jgi:hypothetical protein
MLMQSHHIELYYEYPIKKESKDSRGRGFEWEITQAEACGYPFLLFIV